MTYLSGPISSRFFQKRNIRRFFAVAEKLRSKGVGVFNPVENDQPGWKYEQFLAHDLEALRKCDSIFMMKGWESSKGARLEREVARLLKLVIEYE